MNAAPVEVSSGRAEPDEAQPGVGVAAGVVAVLRAAAPPEAGAGFFGFFFRGWREGAGDAEEAPEEASPSEESSVRRGRRDREPPEARTTGFSRSLSAAASAEAWS